MNLPIEISFRDMDSSEAVEARVRERVEKLQRYFDRALSCRVVVEARHRSSRKGKLYNVRLHLSIPGKDVVVGHEHKRDHAHEDVYVAIRDAFNAMESQLKSQAEVMRGKVKAHEVPPHGRIARIFLEDGYGFIESSDGQEVYFHRNSVTNDGFESLSVGDEVRYSSQQGESEKGAQASTVVLIGKHHLPPV